MCKNPEIKSFAFMDIETTNLPDYNFGKANIIEISIYACLRRDIILSENGKIPRTTHKLTLYFNPFSAISSDSSQLCGLYNDMLESENTFNTNAGNVIINFLQHLQKPVCLVAHNGFKFDFPILKKSLEKINIMIPEFILCIDSYELIRKIDDLNKELKETNNTIDEEDKVEDNDNKCSETIEKHDTIVKVEEDIEKDFITKEFLQNEFDETDKFDIQLKKFENNEQEIIDKRQKLNETTPKRSIINTVGIPKRKSNDNNKMNNNSKVILLDQDSSDNCNCERHEFKSRRKLFSTTTSNSPFISTSKKSLKYPPKGYYKLSSIYNRIYGKQPDILHHAEDDVRTLQQIFISPYKNEFLKYADENAIKFVDISSDGFR